MTAAAKDRELRQSDAQQAFFEGRVDDEIYILDFQGILGFSGGKELLNNMYGLVQAEMCWFN